jgi:hypothetical protein
MDLVYFIVVSCNGKIAVGSEVWKGNAFKSLSSTAPARHYHDIRSLKAR